MSFPAYPGYKDSGVDWLGHIPEGWSIKPLWALFRRHKLTGFSDEQLLSVYRDYGVIPKASRDDNFNTPSDDLGAYQLVQVGDLAINKMKAWQGSVGISSYKGIVSPAYHVYAPSHSEFPQYLHHLFRCNEYIAGYLANSKGIRVNQWDLEPQQHSRMSVLLPALQEQTQIARFLDHETARIDALIEEQQRLIELLKEKRQAEISQAVTKGLNPAVPMKDSGVEWLGEVPAHWRSRKVKRLFAQSKRQGYTDMEVLSVYRDYGVVKKNSRDDNNNKTPDDLSLYQLVMAGDLVVNKMKAWQGSLGVSEYQGITSPDYVVYSPSHGEAPKFLHYLLRASHMPKVYLSISNGIRPSQWRIEPEKFEQVEVFLPGKREQLEIVTYLENQLTRINVLMLCCEQASNFFSERRSALISAAVTGKIDVRGWQPLASAPTPELAQEAV